MFSRAVRRCSRWRRSTISGRAGSRVSAWRARVSARSGRMVSGSTSARASDAPASEPPGSITTTVSPSATRSPTATDTVAMVPPREAETTCSIFIDSMMSNIPPAATSWPGVTPTFTTVPCSGLATATAPGSGLMAISPGIRGVAPCEAPMSSGDGNASWRTRFSCQFVG